MVFSDTYQTAKQIDSLEPLLTKDDVEKIDLLKELVKKHVNLVEMMGS
jgi:BioD-like phosphotransacetylase family protein